METKRKKELMEEYKNRRPEMGVISFRCKETGESFLGASKNTKGDYNSSHFKLTTGSHPNKRMQELWNQYGEDSFEYSVLKVLEYEDLEKDYTEDLELLRESFLAADPQAKKIWR